jgi:hypothetical protein
VGKQIIGLLPSGGSTPVAPKCLYYAQTFNYSSGWSGFTLDIDGTYFPSAGLPYEIGTSIQSAYQPNAGGYAPNNLGSDIWLWSLEDDPIQTSWQILNYDDFNFYPVDISLLTCDLTTECYYVDIPVGGGTIIDFTLAGIAPFDGQVLYLPTTTNDPSFVTFLQSIFGGQADITVVDNGGSCYIEISKCYSAIIPKNINVNGVLYGFAPC